MHLWMHRSSTICHLKAGEPGASGIIQSKSKGPRIRGKGMLSPILSPKAQKWRMETGR